MTEPSSAREVIAKRLEYIWPNESWYEDGALAVLQALDAAGYTVARLEQVGWVDYERGGEERARRPGYGRFALVEHPGHDGERYGDEPVFRILPESQTNQKEASDG